MVNGKSIFKPQNIENCDGSLNDGLTIEKASEIVFALSSGEMFNVFIQDLAWSKEQYVQWLTDALAAALLPG